MQMCTGAYTLAVRPPVRALSTMEPVRATSASQEVMETSEDSRGREEKG